MSDVLKQKELAVAEHLRSGAPTDGCVCEPCIAAREAFKPSIESAIGYLDRRECRCEVGRDCYPCEVKTKLESAIGVQG